MPNYRPTTYRPSQVQGGRNRVATLRRQDEALRLRRAGLTFAAIAERLGYRGPQGAAEAVRTAQVRLAVEGSDAAINNLVNSTRPASRPMADRTFGVEVEFFGCTAEQAAAALIAAGLPARNYGYTHDVVSHWKIVRDGSVHGAHHQGLELVSPILSGEEGLAEVVTAMAAIRGAGARVNRSCGVHVHVGMAGLNGAQIMDVFEMYTANQRVINGLLAQSRHNSHWCSTTYANYEADNRRLARQASSPTEVRSFLRGLDRYRAVNLSAYAKYGTVEFRQHQGSMNSKKVTSWVRFLLGLVEVATTNPRTYENLGELLEALPIEAETKEYLNSRAQRLATAGSR
jgi:hypothetical protein